MPADDTPGPLRPGWDITAGRYQAVLDQIRRWHTTTGPPIPDPRAVPGVPASLTVGQHPAASLSVILKDLDLAAAASADARSPMDFAHIPYGGLDTGMIAVLVAAEVHRFTGVPVLAPPLVAAEQALLRWWCSRFGLVGPRAGGVYTTGASMGAVHAMIAARQTRPRRTWRRLVVYRSVHAHTSVDKAAQAAGLLVRDLPAGPDLRVDIAAARRVIRRNRLRHGLLPAVIVGTAGHTDTGTIDNLTALADLADEVGAWKHVDAAYGGGFILTPDGPALLDGIGRADSIVTDPAKWAALPPGVAMLLVADVARLDAAFTARRGAYLPDLVDDPDVPDWSRRTLELTREPRGLRLLLPLLIDGWQPFADHLALTMGLARWAAAELACDPEFEVPWGPQLSTVAFRLRHGDPHALIADLGRAGIGLSPTDIDGPVVRLCILSHRTGPVHVRAAVMAIRRSVRAVPSTHHHTTAEKGVAVTDPSAWTTTDIDEETPSAARVYDVYLGGAHNFAADRRLAAEAIRRMPDLPWYARQNRLMVMRAVRHLAERGYRQFLDIGCGLPSQGAVHEVVRGIAPDARVVYVDNEPVAVWHGRIMLADVEGAAMVDGDLTDPASILDHPITRGLFSWDEPIVVIVAAVLHFVPDDKDPVGIMRRIRDALPAGSRLVFSHGTAGPERDASRAVIELYEQSSNQAVPRDPDAVAALLDGWTVLEGPTWAPWIYQFDPDDEDAVDGPRSHIIGAIAAKPDQ